MGLDAHIVVRADDMDLREFAAAQAHLRAFEHDDYALVIRATEDRNLSPVVTLQGPHNNRFFGEYYALGHWPTIKAGLFIMRGCFPKRPIYYADDHGIDAMIFAGAFDRRESCYHVTPELLDQLDALWAQEQSKKAGE